MGTAAPVADADDLAALVRAAASIHVAPALRQYLVELAAASRSHPDLGLGMSPRATLSLLRVSRVRALSAGRAFATPDDVKSVAVAALSHRLMLRADHGARLDPDDAVGENLADVAVPRARS